jgi:molybdate transport repressor ModE-like protein
MKREREPERPSGSDSISSKTAVPEIGLRVAWPEGAEGLDVLELARLLGALQRSPRIATAAESLQMSYRTAWGRLVEAEKRLGLRLVERTKGHGSQITPAGRELREAALQFEQGALKALRGPAAVLAERLRGLSEDSGENPPAPLRLAASHDLLLQRCLSEHRVGGMQIRFVGSSEALLALARGDAELAGFHRPLGERSPPHLAPGGEPRFVVALAHREQGLIVARGNPLRIRDVTDLARSGLRFVNRQRGAATRTWLDRLLQEGGIDAARIVGYDLEESTHLAVAATVAAGGADAGFGLRAAADRFRLGFVAIGTETYWLAGSRPLQRDPRVKALLAAVREMAGMTPGYAVPGIRTSRFHNEKLNFPS